MADRKISDLTNVTGSSIADDDEFVVVDASADETKAITASELRTAIGNGDFTVTGDLTVQGTTVTIDSASAQTVDLGDNDKIRLGDGDDLQIYHDGSNSIIEDTATGKLILKGTDLDLKATDATKYLQGVDGGAVTLFYADATNGAKLATTSTGIDVTGTVTADALTLNDGSTDVQVNSSSANARLDFIASRTSSNLASFRFKDSADKIKLNISQHGDVGFYETTGTTPKFYWDASAESLGIGTSSPSELLHISGGGAPAIRLQDTTNANTYALIDTGNNGQLRLKADDGQGIADSFISFEVDAAERMRIDSSGNLLVGKTSASFSTAGHELRSGAAAIFVRDGNDALSLNRLTSDGSIAKFSKDGSNVGTIATLSGRMAIGSGDVGLFFDSTSSEAIEPHNMNTNSVRDAAIDIGASTSRFKDLYLSSSTIIDRSTSGDAVVIKTGGTERGSIHVGTGGSITYDSQTDTRFQIGGSEAMRIDSSGHLLVGKSTSAFGTQGIELQNDGELIATKNGTPIYVNRLTTDGAMQNFYKDGSLVGSIGTNNSRIAIYSANAGLHIASGILPSDSTGARSDNTVDIGNTNYRFKDAHFSGTVNAATLNIDGGTVKLDGNYPTGTGNVALGDAAFDSVTSGAANVAIGTSALTANTSGTGNTGVGYNSLISHSTGNFNTAVGNQSLYSNTTANSNTAVGYQSLYANTTGTSNTALGREALSSNTTGVENVAVGREALDSNTSGGQNVAVGLHALLSNTTANNNTALGYQAGYSNTTGTQNVAVGSLSLDANTSGRDDTAIGFYALSANTTASYSTAVGSYALGSNTTGGNNTAVGYSALWSNTTASNNTAVGYEAGYSNTTATDNTYLGYYAGRAVTGGNNVAIGSSALGLGTGGNDNVAIGRVAMANTTGGSSVGVGYYALSTNTSGARNVAVGKQALNANTTASNNTAVGHQAMYANTTGTDNTAVGYQALDANTTGYSNVAVGGGATYQAAALGAITTGYNNTAVGSGAGSSLTTANSCTIVGRLAGYTTTGANNTFIGETAGYLVTTGATNTILGRHNGNQGGVDIRTSSNNIVLADGAGNPRLYYLNSASAWRSAEIYNNTTGNSANVTILSSGTIARSTSSLKYKRDVVDATHGLSDLLNLRSVTYKGKNPEEGDTVYGGLIAEEVHDAGLTEFVQYDTEGNPDALAYGNMVSLCIKAIQEQQATITALQARIDALENA